MKIWNITRISTEENKINNDIINCFNIHKKLKVKVKDIKSRYICIFPKCHKTFAVFNKWTCIFCTM